METNNKEDDIRAFWKRVNDVAWEKQISVSELAKCTRSYATFADWRTTNRYPDFKAGVKLAMILGVSAEYLLTGKHRKSLEGIDVRMMKSSVLSMISSLEGISKNMDAMLSELNSSG